MHELAYKHDEWVSTPVSTTSVEAGVLELCRSGSLQWRDTTEPVDTECFSVVVDVSSLGIFSMPSMEVVKGLVMLFRKAYPERINRIYVVPVNAVLRGHHTTLHTPDDYAVGSGALEVIRKLIPARSRHKVVFLESLDDKDVLHAPI